MLCPGAVGHVLSCMSLCIVSLQQCKSVQGFRKLPAAHQEFCHPCFKRGQPQLLSQIQRGGMPSSAAHSAEGPAAEIANLKSQVDKLSKALTYTLAELHRRGYDTLRFDWKELVFVDPSASPSNQPVLFSVTLSTVSCHACAHVSGHTAARVGSCERTHCRTRGLMRADTLLHALGHHRQRRDTTATCSSVRCMPGSGTSQLNLYSCADATIPATAIPKADGQAMATPAKRAAASGSMLHLQNSVDEIRAVVRLGRAPARAQAAASLRNPRSCRVQPAGADQPAHPARQSGPVRLRIHPRPRLGIERIC
jgi:hypothetical protein